MNAIKPEFSKFAFWAAAAAGAVCVLVLAVLTFQSLFRLFGTQPEKKTAILEEKAMPGAVENAHSARSEASGRGDASAQASPGQDVKSVSDTGDPPYVHPTPVSAAPASKEFCTDSATIRQQEHSKSEKNKTLDDFPAQER